MKKITSFVVAGLFAVSLAGCGNVERGGADLGKVLDRTESAMKFFNDYLTKQGVKTASDQHLVQLGGFMEDAMNSKPPVYKTPVGIKLLKDATYSGFQDPNMNSIQETGEKQLFTVEVDFEGKRLIGTANGRSTGMSLGSSLLTGMLLGRLMGRQRGAGIKSGHFSRRKVGTRSTAARSKARSGGRSVGK